MTVSGAARRAAVLGHPVAHSLSPVLHRTAYAQLALDWQYDAVDVEPHDLARFMTGLGPEWVGLSLTMPLKETVLDLLDVVEPRAARVRAVNTVVFDGSRRCGFNTDIAGLVGVLRAADGLADERFSALVVGAGATARSACAALAECGAADVAVAARRDDAVVGLVELARSFDLPAAPVAWPLDPRDLTRDVVISTVPADAVSQVDLPPAPGLLVDVLYHPWPTPLASRWERAGGAVVGGLELLIGQAVEQVELMTGRRPDVELMRRAGQEALRERSGAPSAQADQRPRRSTP